MILSHTDFTDLADFYLVNLSDIKKTAETVFKNLIENLTIFRCEWCSELLNFPADSEHKIDSRLRKVNRAVVNIPVVDIFLVENIVHQKL